MFHRTFAWLLLGGALVHCSQLDCDEGEIQVGTGCRRLRDAGRGASVVDGGGRDRDGATPRELDATSNNVFGNEPDSESESDCTTTCEDDGNPCTREVLRQRSGVCTTCVREGVPPSLDRADGCCLASSNANDDVDCPAVCGNGAIEVGETCDSNCPTDCADADPCTYDKVVGSGCNRTCERYPQGLKANDGCCIAGESWQQDATCPVRYRCGSSCPSTDQAATPGDDRAGYVTCGNISCGPGTRCQNPLNAAVPTCSTAYRVGDIFCDGPEDCPDGQWCFQESPSGTQCHESPLIGSSESECHSDADCDLPRRCIANPMRNRAWPVSHCSI